MTEPGKDKQEIEAKKQIVLVVDGKPMRQFYTSIFLQRLKYHVIMAKTAADGLVFMDLTVPLVVIVNIDLPDMSGLDILKRVKQNPKMRNVPVVVYTSNKDPRIQAECEQAGCAGYLKASCHPRGTVRGHPEGHQEASALRPAGHFPRSYRRRRQRWRFEREGLCSCDLRTGYVRVRNTRFTCESVHSFTFFLPNAPGWIIRVEGEIVSRDPNKLREQA